MSVQVPTEVRAVRYSGAGVISLRVGAGKRTLILCKSSMCSKSWNHLSSFHVLLLKHSPMSSLWGPNLLTHEPVRRHATVKPLHRTFFNLRPQRPFAIALMSVDHVCLDLTFWFTYTSEVSI